MENTKNPQLKFTHSHDIGDEILFLKDRPTYAANFKLSSTPKNILADTSEMSPLDLSPNNFHRFKNFCIFPCQSLRKLVKKYQRSAMTQNRLNGLATLSINYEMRDFTTITHGFARKR